MISLFIGTVGQADDDFIISQSPIISQRPGAPLSITSFCTIRKREINFSHLTARTTQFRIKESFLIRQFFPYFLLLPLLPCPNAESSTPGACCPVPIAADARRALCEKQNRMRMHLILYISNERVQCNVNNEIIIHTRLADYFMRAHKLLPRLLFVLAAGKLLFCSAVAHTLR
jgi:hypothetical protein